MRRAAGFAIPSGIFLIVIMALLGAFIVSVAGTQQITSAQDLQGVRAYRAARMGLEWAAATLCNGAGCAAPRTTCPAASTTLATTPDGFTVVVACTVNSYDEGGTTRYIFRVVATATSGGAVGGIGFVERSVGAFIEFPG